MVDRHCVIHFQLLVRAIGSIKTLKRYEQHKAFLKSVMSLRYLTCMIFM